MSGPEVQVLVVVQEALLAGAISRALADAGYSPHWAARGDGALEMAGRRPYAAFIVELVLPDMLGGHLIHALRSRGRCAPVLLLGGAHEGPTADSTVSRLPKPFTAQDLVTRLREMLGPARSHAPPLAARRSPLAVAASGRLSYHRLEMDPETREVVREGRAVSLTDREFAVLDCLMRRPEEVVSKADLSRAVWGEDDSTRSNVLEVYINFLRRKIDHGFTPKLLHTVRGAGYVLRAG